MVNFRQKQITELVYLKSEKNCYTIIATKSKCEAKCEKN
jgi:hypothetical protein